MQFRLDSIDQVSSRRGSHRSPGARLRLRLGALAAAVALLVSAVPAAAAPDVSQLCTERFDAAFASHGQCVSAFETLVSGNASAVGVCKLFGDSSGFKNPGECVETLRQRGF
jgi:hypothetical protein